MNIYLQNETDFTHNGLGFLTDILNAKVEDNLNGDYSLVFEYKINGKLSEYLVNENIVRCKVADGTNQLFLIKNVIKTFNSIQVTCRHIFYQLLDNFVEDVAPTNLSPQLFLQWVLDRTNYENNFVAHSDISATKSARYVRRNPVDCILGDTDNSMVNLFGGELKRDNFDIYFNSRIGSDKGVKLIIGKNVTGINITVDTNSVHTKIMPQGYDGLLLPEKYVNSILINNYVTPKIYKVEFGDIKYDPEDETAYHTEEEAYEALRNAVEDLFNSGIDKPTINVKIDWIELSKTNEYKDYVNLERVNLGDTITIDLLGTQYQSRVIKTIYNPLNDKTETFEIGTPKANLSTSTNQIIKQLEKATPSSILAEAQKNATDQLTKAMGGYVYKTENELFIMDTNDKKTAQKVWRWNLNGLGYSSSGINGPFETAITQDGQIVADFITTGKLNTAVIEGYESLILDVKDATEKVDKVYGQVETSIKDIKPYYAVSTSDTTPPTTGWTDQVPVRQPNEYLWRRDLITYQSETTEYTVPYMATGDKGDTGTGVQSITTQFYLSNSKETQTGGSWVETMPSWTNGKYLWTRNKIVYKNPTSTVYTEPVCDSSYDAVNEATQEFNTKFEMTSQQINSVVNSISEQESAINNITQTINETTNQISETGGSNLLLNTRFYQNADEWEKSENASFEVLLDNQDFISKTESKTAIKMKNGSISQQFSTIIGQQYTLSFKYKKAGINIRNSQIYLMIGSKKIDIFSTTSQVNDITEFSYTYNATTTSPVIYIETDNDDFYVSDLIVQTGTSKIWTPNPSETRGLGHKLTRDELELYDIASSGESVKMTPNSLRYYQNNNQVTEYSKNRMNTPYAEIEQGKIGNITITKVGNDITLFS